MDRTASIRSAIVVREYDHLKDQRQVEEVERRCEVGPSGKLSIYTDLLGDPLCRVRNSPAFLMLVAESGNEAEEYEGKKGKEKEKEIAGMIRGCVKTVTCGKRLARSGRMADEAGPRHVPVYTKVGYILGLRVSPVHRRKGIASRLVESMETWLVQNGAVYSYIATEKDNAASVSLFTLRFGYSKFRTPSLLVNPVHAHDVHLPSRRFSLLTLSKSEASSLYISRFSTTEFFPHDIDDVLSNPHSLGTFLALPKAHAADPPTWNGVSSFLADPPKSWAVLSLWNCEEVFKLEVKGASWVVRALVRAGRALDGALPFLGLPSFPEIFRPFGAYFAYGVGGEGPHAAEMVRALFGRAHNLARQQGCAVVATEVAGPDPLRAGIPHWRRLSCSEDLWCIKRLWEDYSDGAVGDWTKSPPGLSIFVDPREV